MVYVTETEIEAGGIYRVFTEIGTETADLSVRQIETDEERRGGKARATRRGTNDNVHKSEPRVRRE